jgi:hypothetical protein
VGFYCRPKKTLERKSYGCTLRPLALVSDEVALVCVPLPVAVPVVPVAGLASPSAWPPGCEESEGVEVPDPCGVFSPDRMFCRMKKICVVELSFMWLPGKTSHMVKI